GLCGSHFSDLLPAQSKARVEMRTRECCAGSDRSLHRLAADRVRWNSRAVHSWNEFAGINPRRRLPHYFSGFHAGGFSFALLDLDHHAAQLVEANSIPRFHSHNLLRNSDHLFSSLLSASVESSAFA